MSASLTEKELQNIYLHYEQYGAENLGDFIRSIWKEAYEEGRGAEYKRGYIEGYHVGRRKE